MATLYVMRTGQTVFEAQSRVDSVGGSPLTDEGIHQVAGMIAQLAGRGIDAIYASEAEAEQQTADMVAEALTLKVRTAGDLREIDYGLWQGLTLEEIQRRQPKAYRQWTQTPTTLCPPGGETLVEAQHRVRKNLKQILHRPKCDSPLIVVRPVVMGLVRCIMENHKLETFWQHVDHDPTWCSYQADSAVL